MTNLFSFTVDDRSAALIKAQTNKSKFVSLACQRYVEIVKNSIPTFPRSDWEALLDVIASLPPAHALPDVVNLARTIGEDQTLAPRIEAHGLTPEILAETVRSLSLAELCAVFAVAEGILPLSAMRK